MQAFDSFSRAWKQSRRRAGAAAELCCVRLGLAKREGKTTSLLRAGQIAAVVLVVLLLVSVGVGLVATAHPPTQVSLLLLHSPEHLLKWLAIACS